MSLLLPPAHQFNQTNFWQSHQNSSYQTPFRYVSLGRMYTTPKRTRWRRTRTRWPRM